MWECSVGTQLEAGSGCNPHCIEVAHRDRAMFMRVEEWRQSSPFLAVSSCAAGDRSGRHRTGKICKSASRTLHLACETSSRSAMALAACLHGNDSRNGIRETPDEPLAAWGQPSQQCSHHQQDGKSAVARMWELLAEAASGHKLPFKQAERRPQSILRFDTSGGHWVPTD